MNGPTIWRCGAGSTRRMKGLTSTDRGTIRVSIGSMPTASGGPVTSNGFQLMTPLLAESVAYTVDDLLSAIACNHGHLKPAERARLAYSLQPRRDIAIAHQIAFGVRDRMPNSALNGPLGRHADIALEIFRLSAVRSHALCRTAQVSGEPRGRRADERGQARPDAGLGSMPATADARPTRAAQRGPLRAPLLPFGQPPISPYPKFKLIRSITHCICTYIGTVMYYG